MNTLVSFKPAGARFGCWEAIGLITWWVLLLGLPGVGRSVLAAPLHRYSAWRFDYNFSSLMIQFDGKSLNNFLACRRGDAGKDKMKSKKTSKLSEVIRKSINKVNQFCSAQLSFSYVLAGKNHTIIWGRIQLNVTPFCRVRRLRLSARRSWGTRTVTRSQRLRVLLTAAPVTTTISDCCSSLGTDHQMPQRSVIAL
jgi:hypothetical protein